MFDALLCFIHITRRFLNMLKHLQKMIFSIISHKVLLKSRLNYAGFEIMKYIVSVV